MQKNVTKSLISNFVRQNPGGFASRDELRRIPKLIAGYLLTGVLPERIADAVFQRSRRRSRTRFETHLEQDPIVERMKALLDDYCSDGEIREGAKRYHETRMEDTWGRWQASHKSNWPVRTEVNGLERVNSALKQGSGVVFWGMSFCGVLFPKIALSRAGVALTQLSSADHGADYPLTLLGRRIVGPLYCLPEGRYLSERIRIPLDGDKSYSQRIGDVLQNNGCIWISGESVRAKKPATAELLGRRGYFPVGAVVFALRNDATLLPVHTQRLGPFHYRVTIESPIPLNRTAHRTDVINQAVQDYANRLAAQILKSPGDWNWEYEWSRTLLMDR